LAPNTDPTDNVVTGQEIAIGDGSTKSFQLVLAFGGFIEPMLAPNTGATINIYFNGVIQPAGHTVSDGGTSTPGVLTFTSTPGNGVVITADFSYYWPCRFDTDSFDFSLFMSSYYEVKRLPLISGQKLGSSFLLRFSEMGRLRSSNISRVS
jgi:uncharacterized protein (TIGR02217 family)